jgi:phytanoyl-CoA hydroxylase
MDFTRLKPDYDVDGFVIVRQLLAPNALAALRRELDRYVRDVVPTLPETSAFYEDRSRPETLKQLHRMGHDPYFAAYRENAAWLGLASALVGEEVRAEQPEWFNKPPMSKDGTPPHQDNYYFCLVPCNVVTVWLALDEIDEGNACLRYVRGSHLRPVRPHGRSKVLGFSQGILDFGEADVAGEVPIRLSPGDAVAHHGNLIHRAEPNRSAERHRRAFAMVFKGVSCRRDEAAFARYKAALAEQQRQLGLAV